MKVRSWVPPRPDPAVVAGRKEHFEKKRAANADRLARLRRVLIHAFPARDPAAVVLVDVGRREIDTLLGEEVIAVNEKLAGYDLITALDVRPLLRALHFEPGERRLAELGPPQKTRRLNKQGRTLKITTKLLVQGSCGISRPFGDEKLMRRYLRDGEHTRLRRRLEADAKSLLALYQYGRLHGWVRLRWGFLDETIPAPWVHRDEEVLYGLMKRAHEHRAPLEVVVGNAPGWSDPWSRAEPAYVEKDADGWQLWLVDEEGYTIDEAEVQLARFAMRGGSSSIH